MRPCREFANRSYVMQPALGPAASVNKSFGPAQIWDTAFRMLCKYRGLQEPLQFRDFMEVQVGTLARKPVRARCASSLTRPFASFVLRNPVPGLLSFSVVLWDWRCDCADCCAHGSRQDSTNSLLEQAA